MSTQVREVVYGEHFRMMRSAAEAVATYALTHPNARIAIVARDPEVFHVLLKPSLLALPWPFCPEYRISSRTLRWLSDSVAVFYEATQPNVLRGAQHHAVWVHDIQTWPRDDDGIERSIALDMLSFGLRLGDDRRMFYTDASTT